MGSLVFKVAVSTVVRNKVTRQCPTTQLLRITSCIKTIKTDHLAPHLLRCCQRSPWTVGMLAVFWWILRSSVRCWHNVFRPSVTCSNSIPPPPPPPISFSRTRLIILPASLCASWHINSSLLYLRFLQFCPGTTDMTGRQIQKYLLSFSLCLSKTASEHDSIFNTTPLNTKTCENETSRDKIHPKSSTAASISASESQLLSCNSSPPVC